MRKTSVHACGDVSLGYMFRGAVPLPQTNTVENKLNIHICVIHYNIRNEEFEVNIHYLKFK